MKFNRKGRKGSAEDAKKNFALFALTLRPLRLDSPFSKLNLRPKKGGPTNEPPGRLTLYSNEPHPRSPWPSHIKNPRFDGEKLPSRGKTAGKSLAERPY